MSECLCTEMVRIGEGSKHFLGHASLLCSCHQPSPALRTMQRTRCCTVSWMVAEPTIPYFVIQLSYDWLYCRWCIVFQPHLDQSWVCSDSVPAQHVEKSCAPLVRRDGEIRIQFTSFVHQEVQQLVSNSSAVTPSPEYRSLHSQ